MELPPKLHNDGNFRGLPVYEETLFQIPKGTRTTLKAQIDLWNGSQHKMVSCVYHQHFTLVADIPSDAKHVSLINVKVDRDHRGTILRVDELSECLVIPTLLASDFYNLKETCVGVGALGVGAEFAGWKIKGVNDQQETMCELQRKIAKACVVKGDIAFGSVVGELYRTFERPCPLALGFSCQAFSKAGDQLGGADQRSMSLPRALHAAYLTDAPFVVLECVSEAPTYAFVRNAIQQFCDVTHFAKSEIIMNLGELWVSQRKRWWCVLINPEIGKVPLSPLPSMDKPPVISDFCAEFQIPEVETLEEVKLTHQEYQQMMNLGISLSDNEINKHGQMPTALHSWGNQFQKCQCGCRTTGLATSRLSRRGFFGVLIKMVNSEGQLFYRHPTSQEIALFCGLPLKMDFSGNPRLEIAAVGQLASPLQSGWIFSLIRGHLQQQNIQIGQFVREGQILGSLLQALFDMRREVWPHLQETMAMQMFEQSILQRFPIGDCEKKEEDSSMETEVETESVVDRKRKPESNQESFSQKLAKVANRNQTEVAFVSNEVKAIHGAIPGFEKAVECTGQQKEISQPAIETPVETVPVEEIPIENVGAIPGFVQAVECKGQQKEISQPVIEIPAEKVLVEEISIGKVANKVDSEIRFFVSPDFAVTPGDLYAKRTVIFNRIENIIYAISVTPGTKVEHFIKAEGIESPDVEIVSVMGNIIPIDAMVDHWQCLIIQKSEQSFNGLPPEILQVELSKIPRYQSILLQGARVAYEEFVYYMSSFIHAEQAKVVSPIVVLELTDVGLLVESWMQEVRECDEKFPVASAIVTNDHWIPFMFKYSQGQWVGKSSPEGCCLWELFGIEKVKMQLGSEVGKCFDFDCGFQTFAWLMCEVMNTERHLIPLDQAALWRSLLWQHQLATNEKVTNFEVVIFGGAADELVTAVAALLKEHGVFQDRVLSRTQATIDTIGRQQIVQAIQGTRPWVALKQLANQKSPPFKLIREDEFQAVLQHRAKIGKPVGQKRMQKESVSQDVSIQPDELQVPSGVFVQEDGNVVHQISVGQIGAVGKGLVVCNEKEVQPFLETTQLSEAGLAFAVVNPTSSFVQEYGQPIRFPANCRKTNEPVLVSAVLVQRGFQQVGRAIPQHPLKIQEVEVTTAKVLVYKDQIEGEWQTFCEAPLKYVLQQVVCLASCKKNNCTCKSWHPASDPGNEPLLDVWNRDFLTGAFRKTKASDAIMFACAIRVRTDVFSQVLNASGNGGVYVEPRTDDGKGHSSNYHTVWLNKMSFDEAVAAKATAKCCAYLIRVNRRYGLKTDIGNAEALHAQFRAEVPMLVEGKREVYQVGPLPWGTTRSSLQKLFEQWQWAARPLQPVGRAADGKGLMWLAQATAQPGATAVAMAHGDVIIVRQGVEVASMPKVPAVEASSHTMTLGPKLQTSYLMYNEVRLD